MRPIVICGLPGCTTFFTFANKQQEFQKKEKKLTMCVRILFTTFIRNISRSKYK